MMASTIFHYFHNQIKATKNCKLFEGSDGYGNGDQMRDFIYVENCVDVNFMVYEKSRNFRDI